MNSHTLLLQCFRMAISIIVIGFGIAVFFVSTDNNTKLVGLSLVGIVFSSWVSMDPSHAHAGNPLAQTTPPHDL